MSQLNFSISAPQSGMRKRAYNPRGKVSFNSTSLLWTAVSIAVVMAVVFAVVWYI
jgi:hypothetical protein